MMKIQQAKDDAHLGTNSQSTRSHSLGQFVPGNGNIQKQKKISQSYGYVVTFSQVFVTEVLVVVSWGVNNQQKTSRQILAKCQP